MMMNMEAMMIWGVSHSSSSSLHEDGHCQQFGGWRKGPWTPEEDKLLSEYVGSHGEGRWSSVSQSSGLKRSGKSCRLRWVNYLRPGLKRGQMTPQEEGIIIELHALWGNKWSTIARYLPGRTDNEIKNYWRTHFKKKPENRTSGHHKQDKRKMQSILHKQMTHHQLQQQQQQQPAAAQNHPITNVVHKEKEHAAEAIWEPVEDGMTLSHHQNPIMVECWPSEFTGDEDVLWGGLWNFVDAVPAAQPPVLMDCNKTAMQ